VSNRIIRFLPVFALAVMLSLNAYTETPGGGSENNQARKAICPFWLI